jgi:two-component system, response regulator YesN
MGYYCSEEKEAMWNVLIADGNPEIKEALKEAIESFDADLQVIAEAADAELALDVAISEQPDIVCISLDKRFLHDETILDRMRADAIDCVVLGIIPVERYQETISSFGSRVFMTITTPLTREVFEAAMSATIEELRNRLERNKYVAWASRQLESNLGALRERFMLELLNGHLSDIEIKDMVPFLGLRFPAEIGLLVVKPVEMPTSQVYSRVIGRHILQLAVKDLTAETAEELKPIMIFLDDKDNVVALVCTEPRIAWKNVSGRISHLAQAGLKNSVLVAQRIVAGGIEVLNRYYDDAVAELSRQTNYTTYVLLAEAYIQKNYLDPTLTLQDLADELDLSGSYISRILRQELGLSFVDYLSRVRVNRSIQLLNDPEASPEEIARLVGFRTSAALSQAFEKVLAVSPEDYRKGIISS